MRALLYQALQKPGNIETLVLDASSAGDLGSFVRMLAVNVSALKSLDISWTPDPLGSQKDFRLASVFTSQEAPRLEKLSFSHCRLALNSPFITSAAASLTALTFSYLSKPLSMTALIALLRTTPRLRHLHLDYATARFPLRPPNNESFNPIPIAHLPELVELDFNSLFVSSSQFFNFVKFPATARVRCDVEDLEPDEFFAGSTSIANSDSNPYWLAHGDPHGWNWMDTLLALWSDTDDMPLCKAQVRKMSGIASFLLGRETAVGNKPLYRLKVVCGRLMDISIELELVMRPREPMRTFTYNSDIDNAHVIVQTALALHEMLPGDQIVELDFEYNYWCRDTELCWWHFFASLMNVRDIRTSSRNLMDVVKKNEHDGSYNDIFSSLRRLTIYNWSIYPSQYLNAPEYNALHGWLSERRTRYGTLEELHVQGFDHSH
ncbi:hypothetical protein HGRIS_009022 [Hohenbuehelia grisea]|uniref:Uncharacterized protein n=1 Tax=Hohenbuehelia grisea TaxID=104357 RepID=A0ABR3J078_9AGAR